MRFRLRAAAGVLVVVVGAALLVSACGSSSKSSSTQSGSSPTSSTASQRALQAAPDPCSVVTTQVIGSALNERMTQVKRFPSSCGYTNSAGTNKVSISTGKTTPAGAQAAVVSATHTATAISATNSAKVKVVHLSGVGDSAIAYLIQRTIRSIAVGLVAKNGTLVLVNLSGPNANQLLPAAIALTKAAASRTS